MENAEREGRLLLPVEWSLNPEDIKDVDMVVGIVGNWIKNSSFIEECIQSGKEVVLFFNIFQDPKNTILSEQIEIEDFQKKLEGVCLCEDFNCIAELDSLLKKHLNIFAEA